MIRLLFRAIKQYFCFCEQTGRSPKIFFTSFAVPDSSVCHAEAQLEFKTIVSSKVLSFLFLFLPPAMRAEIQRTLFPLSASTLLHLIASKKLVSLFHPLPRQQQWPMDAVLPTQTAARLNWAPQPKLFTSKLLYNSNAWTALPSLTRLRWQLDAALSQLLLPFCHQTKAFPIWMNVITVWKGEKALQCSSVLVL